MKFFERIFKRSFLAQCGHKTLIRDWVFAFGEGVMTRVPVIDGKVYYCHKCLQKMAIRCAWCGKTIFIGDAVTLYAPKEEFEIPEHAVPYEKNSNRLVGCLRWECALSGADRAGFWMPPGKVERMPSPIETALGTTDPIVFFEDVSNRNGKVSFSKNPK